MDDIVNSFDKKQNCAAFFLYILIFLFLPGLNRISMVPIKLLLQMVSNQVYRRLAEVMFPNPTVCML